MSAPVIGHNELTAPDRRRFIAACGRLAALLVLPGCVQSDFDIVGALSKQFGLHGSLLGKLARETLPQPFDAGAVRERFRRKFDEPGPGVKASNVAERYDAIVKAEFEGDKVVNVHGWLLAEIERDLLSLA